MLTSVAYQKKRAEKQYPVCTLEYLIVLGFI